MRFYYQYDGTGIISVRVKSATKPSTRYQIAVDKPLQEGIKIYAPLTREVIYLKNEYDEQGQYVRTIEDASKTRKKIAYLDTI